MKTKNSWPAALLAAWLLPAWAPAAVAGQRPIDEIVARVNNDIVLRSEYEQQLEAIRADLTREAPGPQLQQMLAGAEESLMRDMIDRSLLTQKAREYGINAEVEVVRTMERMRQEYNFESLEALEAAIVAQGDSVEDMKESIRTQYLSQRVLQSDVYPRIIITTEEVRRYYEENLASFDRPEGVRLQEIVFNTAGRTPEEIADLRRQAEAALARVRGGEAFEAVAAEVSMSATASVGGDLGFFERGSLREDYEALAAGLARNRVSDVTEVANGFVILKLLDRHTGGILPFELAQQEIQNVLWSERIEPRIRDYLTRLRREGFVWVREGYTDIGAVAEE